MNIQEFYVKVDGDYSDVQGRLATDDRIIKFVKMFASMTDGVDLANAIEAEDWEKAFMSSHNLKGMSANLGLTSLYQASSDLCENLRGKSADAATLPLYEAVKERLDCVMACIAELE